MVDMTENRELGKYIGYENGSIHLIRFWKMNPYIAISLTTLLFFSPTSRNLASCNMMPSSTLIITPSSNLAITSNLETVLQLKGGQVISGKKKQSPLKAAMNLLDQVKPATRVYIVLSLLCTIAQVIGLPAEKLFSLESSNLIQFWRIFTSKTYLGFSMSMANNLYFLLRYGQALENSNGTGYNAWFFLIQTITLSVMGLLVGLPFQAKSFVAATVYSSCHLNPFQQMQFQFEITILAWQLPFCLMGMDCLTSQSLDAAWPHLLGIFSGHLFHFFTSVWPALGGRAWLEPPKWFLKKFGEKPSSNIPGVSFRKKEESPKSKYKNVGSGRKLGSSLKK